MKKIQIQILAFIILIAPLYPALLTEDLRVVIPTGNMEIHENCDLMSRIGKDIPGYTLRLIQSTDGIVIIKEQSNPWMTISQEEIKFGSHNQKQVILNFLQQQNLKEHNYIINVILE